MPAAPPSNDDPARPMTCKRPRGLADDGSRVYCEKLLPKGPLPFFQYNTRTGCYPRLCAECREEVRLLAADMQEASLGTPASAVTTLRLLPEHEYTEPGELVSLIDLRDVLIDLEMAGSKGPLTDEQIELAIRVLLQRRADAAQQADQLDRRS